MTPAEEKETKGRPAGRGKSAWIVAPAELCALCRRPLLLGAERSSWNGEPAHRECVRIRTLQHQPAFRGWSETGSEEGEDPGERASRSDEDEDEGWPG